LDIKFSLWDSVNPLDFLWNEMLRVSVLSLTLLLVCIYIISISNDVFPIALFLALLQWRMMSAKLIIFFINNPSWIWKSPTNWFWHFSHDQLKSSSCLYKSIKNLNPVISLLQVINKVFFLLSINSLILNSYFIYYFLWESLLVLTHLV
jgi:hypothetical protein